ncbi:MAG: DUF1499 domain-containing protein [Pseudomonadota bacterium]
MSSDVQDAGWRQTFALSALILSVLAVIWFLAAALGTKFGLWGWQFGLGQMYFSWGPIVVGITGAVALAALVVSLIGAPRKRPFMLALGALFISGALIGRLFGLAAGAQSLPPIHDVQTDWERPVAFSQTLLDARETAGALNQVLANPVIPDGANARWPGMGGMSNADAQAGAIEEERYEAIAPLTVGDAPGAVFDRAMGVVERRGWEVVTSDKAAGVIEATETSFWFGFKDDVAIRITAEGAGSRVDMRSVSRVGLSDLGANQKRIYLFLQDVNASR